jgi:type III restriction enzyme
LKLHFDPHQQFQLEAIDSIVGIFEGQPLNRGDFDFSIAYESYFLQEGGIGNRLTLDEEQILENVKAIQKENELPVTDKLDGMNFSVEMETGTADRCVDAQAGGGKKASF